MENRFIEPKVPAAGSIFKKPGFIFFKIGLIVNRLPVPLFLLKKTSEILPGIFYISKKVMYRPGFYR
jgi:hypothetical protein